MMQKSTISHVVNTSSHGHLLGRLAAVVALAGGLFLVGPATPASAAPALRVSPAQGLDVAGQIVAVSGGGYQPGIQLFVMQCRAASAQDHTCNSVGLQKVTTDAAGAFSARIRVVGNFGATDCLRTACAVKTSAVSGHADDRSQDVSTGIGFAASAPPATQPPATQPPATQPPATQPPATPAPTTPPPSGDPTTTTSTAAAGATTTTAPAPTATTEVGAVSSTTAETDDATAGDDDGSTSEAETAGAPVVATRDAEDGGSGSGPVVAGAVVVLLAAGGGTAFYLRRRAAA